ncbi:MAG: glycosyltransferase family 2 protein [Dermabacter sp.]|nr:glycosyltransferase family 2 protein [Dermabacter sp.]
MPEVSVIIPCFNATGTLGRQLEALFSQESAPEFEIVVVDNRSTDDLAGFVASVTPPAHVSVRLVEAPEVAGAAYARNVGVREADGDLLLFCDADDVVSAWWVAHALRTFEVADVWSGSCIPVPGSAFALPLEQIRALIDDTAVWRPPVREQEGSFFPVLMGGNFGVRRDTMLALGGFDAGAPAGGEDNDLGIRAGLAGFPTVTCKVTKIAYRQRDGGAAARRAATNAARAQVQLGMRYGIWKHSAYRHWVRDLARAFAAHVRQVLRPRRVRDVEATKVRIAVAFTIGATRVAHLCGRPLPLQRIGLGLDAPASPTPTSTATGSA